MHYRSSFLVAVALGLMAGAASAENRALIVGNDAYDNAADIRGARAALDAAEALRDAGFSVTVGRNQTSMETRADLSPLIEAEPGDRVVILLAGHFAQSVRESWFLGAKAATPDLATADVMGVSLDTVFDIAAAYPGGAVVLLGQEDRRIELGAGLTAGIGRIDPPHGVTVIAGSAEDIARFARRDLIREGSTLARLVAENADLTAYGYLSALTPFLPTAMPQDAPEPATPPMTTAQQIEDRLAWLTADRDGTREAYQRYLDRYPQGAYVQEARTKQRAIPDDPVQSARLAEDALNLSRDQRREIQRDLSLLNFDTRGIDGLFGPGTRTAIARWQAGNDETSNGYLTRAQIQRLAAQADRRAEELEREAAERRAEQEREDQIYWDQTGVGGDEAGLRAYLKRYPDGLFAEVATDRLAAFEAERRRQAEREDRAAWDRAVAADTVVGYREYLDAFPQGAFAAAAKSRIDARTGEQADAQAIARARAAEQALNLNGITRNLVESRLRGLGLRPGNVDGQFDADTRRAIRRFQANGGIPVTGYLDQQTLVRLLAGR